MFGRGMGRTEQQKNKMVNDVVAGRRWHASVASHWVAVGAFVVVALLIIAIGWWVFDYQKMEIRQQRKNGLKAIATLKAQQITTWRQEKLNDAELFRVNSILAAQLSEWLERGAPNDHLYQLLYSQLSSILHAYDYHAVALLDCQLNPLIFVGEKWALGERSRVAALKALRTKQSLYADLTTQHDVPTADGGHIHLDLLIPLLDGEEQNEVGLLVIRLEPEKFLLPLIENWPTPSNTAESVLLKPTPDGVIRVSGRRHLNEGVSRTIKFPTDRVTPPLMVSEGQEGVVEHNDYRNVPTLSYVKKVENTPWFLVAKVDKAEIYAPVHRLARQIALLVVFFVAAAGLIAYYWWRQQRALFFASHYQAQLDKQLLEQRFHSVTKHANDIILLVNQDGLIVDANHRALEAFGYSYQQIMELKISDLRLVEDREQSQEQRRQLEKQGALLFEAQFLRQDGSTFPAEVSARLIELDGHTYFQGILRDITERKRAEEQIMFLAHHDCLTGLPNRNLLQDRLRQNLARARRNGSKCAILFLDFDRFKNINDSLGHSVGDGVLKEVAVRLQSCLREGDTVARVGGDEFVILLSDLEDPRPAVSVAQKITALGTQPYEVEGQKFRLTISIGICMFPEDGGDFESLLKNADSAMYHAKNAGRNTFSFYTDDMNAKTLEVLNLERDLQNALENNDFTLHYQPQIDLASGSITGVEALLRWTHPVHGEMSPAVFIPIAEEHGLITAIGNWVLETACKQSVEWQEQGLPPIRMAVNISALQLHHIDFYEWLSNTLGRTGMNPELLELELTESAVMQDEKTAQILLQQLKALGVQLAIDDFGTGYSSLSHLKRFPIDKLKIDRSFIKDLPLDTEDGAITQAIIGVGRSLKQKVIAEGVETIEQQNFLRQEGCDEMQGFYFSRPVPADQLALLLKNSTVTS